MPRRFERRKGHPAQAPPIVVVFAAILLSSTGCAANRAQPVGRYIILTETQSRLETTSRRIDALQAQLEKMEKESAGKIVEMERELAASARSLRLAEARADRLERELGAARTRLADSQQEWDDERAGHEKEKVELQGRIASLESLVANLRSQISVIRARHQVETTRLRKEIERLSAGE